MTLICMKMKLHAELIFIWKVSHLDSFWNRGTRELGNGLLVTHIPIAVNRGSIFASNVYKGYGQNHVISSNSRHLVTFFHLSQLLVKMHSGPSHLTIGIFWILGYPIGQSKAFYSGPSVKRGKGLVPDVKMFDFQTMEIKHSLLSRLSISDLYSTVNTDVLSYTFPSQDRKGRRNRLGLSVERMNKATADRICRYHITFPAMRVRVERKR